MKSTLPRLIPGAERERGSSLVALMVAMGIGLILTICVSRLLGNANATSSSLALRGDRQDVVLSLLAETSCPATIQGVTCPSAGGIPLVHQAKDLTLTTLLPAGGKMVGSVTVRAQCNATNDGIEVRAVRLKRGASGSSRTDYIADPATGKIVTWTDHASLLLPPGLPLCALTQPPLHHSEAVSRVESDTCSGGVSMHTDYSGNSYAFCSSYWYKDVSFQQSFTKVPAVVVTMAEENTRGACGSTSFDLQAYATNVTATGFRLVCATRPLNSTCNPALSNLWNVSQCSWSAYQPEG